MHNCLSPACVWSRWDKENTSSLGSLLLRLLLPWPIRLPIVAWASGLLPVLLPSCPPSKRRLNHSLLPSLSSTLLFPIWPLGRCLALEQALLIEHLFRHGAGSVACGRAAGGSSRGDIMSYYISRDVSFTCMHARFTGTHFYRHWETQTHATTIHTESIVVSILLENGKKTKKNSVFKMTV